MLTEVRTGKSVPPDVKCCLRISSAPHGLPTILCPGSTLAGEVRLLVGGQDYSAQHPRFQPSHLWLQDLEMKRS